MYKTTNSLAVEPLFKLYLSGIPGYKIVAIQIEGGTGGLRSTD